MKKLLIPLCLILSLSINLQAQATKDRPDVCLTCRQYSYPQFIAIKDTVTFETYLEAYTVFGDSVKKGVPQFDRNKFSFHADPGQNDMSDDYYKSGYAVGHINSAKNNAAHQASLKNSMLYINTDLQLQCMNAGPWLGLEDHERDEAVSLGQIHVKVGVYGNQGYTKAADAKHRHVHKAVIPKYWWKALCYPDSTSVWVMSNAPMPQHPADYLKPEFKKSLRFLTDTLHIKFDALP